MAWLLRNYFLPTLNPASVPQSTAPPLRSLQPVLKHFKGLMKITTRDASLGTQYKAEINSMLRDTERWLAEARVAANVAVGNIGWDLDASDQPDTDEIDPRERWALDRLCDALLEKGALVPLSKK